MTDETLVALVKIGACLIGWLAALGIFGKTLNQILRAKVLGSGPPSVPRRDEAVQAMESRDRVD